MDAVDRDLNQILTDDQRAQGGLKVYTTIDPTLQKTSAEQAVIEVQLKKVESQPGLQASRNAPTFHADQQREDEARDPVFAGRRRGHRQQIRGHPRGGRGARFHREQIQSGHLQQGVAPGRLHLQAVRLRGGVPTAVCCPALLIDDGPIARGEVRRARRTGRRKIRMAPTRA